jgi:hypothetical protein
MYQRFVNFTRGVSTNWVGSLGVSLTTSVFLLFITVELLRMLGILTSTYIGLITYMALPALFIFGLVLIPVGWFILLKSTGKKTKELLNDRFEDLDVEGKTFGSNLMRTILILTIVNILFLGGGTARMLHFMEEPEFCGTACHGVMQPEWATYQDSPHAHVACVECHVGEGTGALIDSKINGLWQVISVTLDLYEKPIPTPVHQLRPARETCEKCHWPDKFYGNRLLSEVRYSKDEESTPKYTTLSMKVGSGKGNSNGEIHWHIADQNEVLYASLHDEREKMLWVDSKQPDGSYKRFTNRKLSGQTDDVVRTMDCVDCHNRATHIYEDPDVAIDNRIAEGLISRNLPFIKREAVSAITRSYPTKEAGLEGIANQLTNFYRINYGKQMGSFLVDLDQAIETCQIVYDKNIHQNMNVTWGVYPNNLGHQQGDGCFRCHNPNMVDENEQAISDDCTLCHSILANDSDHPFKFLTPGQKKGDPDYKMHLYHQSEFLSSLDK